MSTRLQQAIVRTIAASKTEILGDIADGLVPVTVASFSELHDYRDANCYGGLCDDEWEYRDVFTFDDEGYARANFIQDRLDDWIRAGFPTASTYDLSGVR
jgi:hypothetical protein